MDLNPTSLFLFLLFPLVFLPRMLVFYPIPSFIYPLHKNWTVTCSPLSFQSSSNNLQLILLSEGGYFAWVFRVLPSETSCALSIVCYNCTGKFIQTWTATPKIPLMSKEAILQVGDHGDIVLRNSATSSVGWSTDGGPISGIKILDTGNLVMFNDLNVIVWQSFDHPANILLPGQTLSTGMKLVTGDYSAVMEAAGLVLYVNTPQPLPYLVLNASWGVDTLDSVMNPFCSNSLRLVYALNGLTLTMEQDATGTTCKNAILGEGSFNKSASTRQNTNSFRYLKLEGTGSIQTYLDDEVDMNWFGESDDANGYGFCNLPSHCGSFGICDPGGQCRCPHPEQNSSDDEYLFAPDYGVEKPESPGCSNLVAINCTGSGANYTHKLLRLFDLDYFPHRYLPRKYSSTLDECLQSCLENCSCVIAFYNNISRFCHHYPTVLSMQRTSFEENNIAFLKVLSKEAATRSQEPLFIGLIMACSIVVLCLTSFSAWWWYRRRRARAATTDDEEFLESLGGLPPRFSVKQLDVITNRFSVKLGEGGFGSVYGGVLPDGAQIAVKKLEGSRQGEKEFRAEVAALSGMNHVNLVRLRGFCAEGGHRMLIYEYMTNGSLDRWLYNKEKDQRALLDLDTRLRIAIDAAKGLAFLHEESRERIFHLDIKPQNILLDENFMAKLSDFGLSKQVDRSQSRAVTSMRGTPGYLAPEWLLQLAVTDKSDVYSYGMVLMEILSGRRNIDYSYPSDRWFFPAWVLQKAADGRWREVIEDICGRCDENGEKIMRAMKVAMWCVQEDPKLRPSMNVVGLMLEGHVEVPDPPTNLHFTLASLARISASLADTNQYSGSDYSSSSLQMPTGCTHSDPGLECSTAHRPILSHIRASQSLGSKL